MTVRTLGWFGIFRLGLVQTALGAIVVLTTSTLNRVMVVELALPAVLPGLLVGLHYAVQITRPRLGHGSDAGGRRTPWIIGGLATLATGGVLAAVATALMASRPEVGLVLAIVAFLFIGIGVGCAGTALLVLLAALVEPRYRGAAATTVWVMMIIGFIVTAIVAGAWLDPFSMARLVAVTGTVCLVALVVAILAVWGIEKRASRGESQPVESVSGSIVASDDGAGDTSFREAFYEVWGEPEARRFSLFVFVSMLAYSAQDLVLEPFAGEVFGMTPGASTQLSGVQHGGVLLGMLLVALATSVFSRQGFGSLRAWMFGGCLASAAMLASLSFGGLADGAYPLVPAVFLLGMANGAFAVAAIGSMMDLVGRGRRRREGVRMGMWGAAQAIAFGLGGVFATVAVDAMQAVFDTATIAYALVFMMQALLFLFAARLAWRLQSGERAHPPASGNVAWRAGELSLEAER